jgi:hypothetical protein
MTSQIEDALLCPMPVEPAIVCRHVADGAPILVAARDGLGGSAECEWHFGCGADQEPSDERRVLDLDEVVRRDPSAVEIVLHPRGTELERHAPSARWHTEIGPVLFPRRPSRRWPRFDPRYPPRKGETLEAADLRLMADVAQWGVHVVSGASSMAFEGPYAFSVGLFRTFDHAEIAFFGLDAETLAAAVRRIAERVRAGERFESRDVAEGILDGRAVAFRRIVPRHYATYLGYAVWYHDGPRFPALQAVWSDPAGRFPWERWFPREARDLQPILFEDEPA